MTNDISKHYSVKLETKSTAKLNNNYLNFNYGDDITLSISIMDDGSPKNIDNCEVDMIIVNESRINPIIHNFSDGGITVANNVVTIVCKSGYIDMIGVNIAQLIIRNADQNISTQMFVYNTVSTLSSNDVESAIDGINTIHDIYELIDRMNSVLESVGSSTDELEGKVNDADTLVRTLVDKANTEIAGVNSIIEQAKASEDERKAAELLRIQNEDTRVSSENLRVASETTREQNELARNTSETSRIEAELVRTNSENKRVTTENLRVEAEIKRSENEAGRVSAEQARVLEFETIKGEQESFKESVNEQILNSKTDYFGEEHLTVDKRLNEDFDKLWQFNNESQLLEYSGINITANDSYYGLVKNLTIKGRTLQNLVPDITKLNSGGSGVADVTKYTNGFKFTVSESGSFVLSSKDGDLFNLKSNTKYTAILNIKSNTTNSPLTVYKSPSSVGLFVVKDIGVSKVVFDTGDLTNFTRISIGSVGSYPVDTFIEVINFMILEGDYTNTPLDQLPFIEGIKSVGEQEVTEDGKYKVRVKSCGKNLININDNYITSRVDNGITWSTSKDGQYIQASGTATSDSYFYPLGATYKLVDFNNLVVGKKYNLSVTLDGNFDMGTSTKGLGNYATIGMTGNYDFSKAFSANTGVSGTLRQNIREFWIRINQGVTVDNIKLHFQLEEGTVATDYEPYKETVVEYQLDEPHMSLPNGACDILDIETGILTKKIKKYTTTGNENISTADNTAYSEDILRFRILKNDLKPTKGATINVICDKLPTYPLDDSSMSSRKNEGVSSHSATSYIEVFINKSRLDTEDVNGFKKWLTGNPITIYYELATPIVEQLEEHHPFSYEGTTHIFSDNLLSPTISCKIPSNVPAVVSSLRSENEILNNEVATLSLENEQLKENNDTQDEVINVSLLATDEMYNMLEPILSMTAEISTLEVREVSKMVDLYVAMIQRGLKTIDQVPERYRKQVQDILDKLDE